MLIQILETIEKRKIFHFLIEVPVIAVFQRKMVQTFKLHFITATSSNYDILLAGRWDQKVFNCLKLSQTDLQVIAIP